MTPPANEPGEIPLELREGALRLLGRREHSQAELRRKLRQREWGAEAVDRLLVQLAEEGLQSDRRFAAEYARSRVRRGYGPVRIRAELSHRGISDPLQEATLEELGVNWMEVLRQEHHRRYGPEPPADFREKARRWRALERKGFGAAQLRGLFS